MELRTLRKDDLEQAWELDRDAFHVPAEHRDRFLAFTDPERHLGFFDAGRLVALTGMHAFGQFFGGRAVPMGGLCSVSVAPDRRGQGLARRLVSAAIQVMHERRESISSLFPATTRLYRDLGWEVAGSTLWRKVLPRRLLSLPRPETGRVRPIGHGDRAVLFSRYAAFAREVNGALERPERWWERLFASWEGRSVFVAENAAGEIEGYVVYRQLDGPFSALGGPFGLAVEELVATTRDASLSLWRLLGSWATQVEQLVYRGAAEDALLLLLPEQDIQVVAEIRWMTRVVDAVGAVEARGFAPGLALEVPLELRDEHLQSNTGRFVLRVAEGRGRLEHGGAGGPVLDVGAFSALYTGWATCAALARAGRLRGGSASERGALDAAFAGPTPWLLEEF